MRLKMNPSKLFRSKITLKGVEEQELEADLVLGADQGNECTYTNGYIKRQAVFSCLTCTLEGNAGVCTACSLSCHDGHEVPRDKEGEPLYEDFKCRAYSTSFLFLGLYPQSIWAAGRQCDVTLDANKDKNVIEDTSAACGSGKVGNDVDAHNNPKIDHSNANSESASNVNGLSLGKDSQKKVVSNQRVKDASTHPACVLGVNLEAASPALDGRPLFLSKNWRDVLCRFAKCLVVYDQKRIAFLLDKEDSIVEDEKMATQKTKEKLLQQEGAELSLFDNLGHIQRMEILSGIADMKDEIRGFLESFDSSKSITAADVHQVFENLAKKRRRIE